MIIAIFVLAVSLIAMASVAASSLASVRGSRDREQAINAASGAIEDVRSRAWDDVVLDPAVAVQGAVGECWESEPLVRNVSTDPVPHVQTVSQAARLTVRTYVTWADADCATGLPKTTKRVVSIVSYSVPGVAGTREVRQETLLAKAERGLPVPEFSLDPPDKTILFSPDDVNDGTELCGRHQLRNLGSPDTYDWAVTKVSGETGSPFKNAPTTFSTPEGSYIVRAFFETPAVETVDVAPASTVQLLGNTELMEDKDGNKRPEAQAVVGETDTANIWVCYKPDPSKVSDGDTLVATVEVHSRFNPDRFETVNQTVVVGFETETWYLYDRDDTTEHPRGVVQNGKTVYPTYTMGVPDGLADSADNLGTTDYTQPSQTDWDNDVDPDRLPGVRLLKDAATTALRSLVWHEQFLATSAVDDELDLSLWVSTTNRLKGTATVTGTQYLEVKLERLKKNESTVDATLHTAVVPYSFDGSESSPWKRLAVDLDLAGDAVFQADQFLRLQITCLNTVTHPSSEDCHVAYDNTTYDSHLRLVLK